MKHKIISAAGLSLTIAFPAIAQQPKHKTTVECFGGVVINCLGRAHRAAASEKANVLTILRDTKGKVSNVMLVHPNGKYDALPVEETLKKNNILETLTTKP